MRPPKPPIRKEARKYALTQKALDARRANLLKARAAPREVIYRATAKRQKASRANLQKAIVARRAPEGNAAARLNALKHGLFTRKVAESIERLGESRAEFEAHLHSFERLFAPEDELESKLVRRIAETTWRRLRLFHAQARWEAERLKRLLAQAPKAEKLSVEECEYHAYALVGALFNHQRLFEEAMKVHSQVERALRALLRKKSDGEIEFKVLSFRRESKREEFSFLDAMDRMIALDSSEEGRAQLDSILERVRRKRESRE